MFFSGKVIFSLKHLFEKKTKEKKMFLGSKLRGKNGGIREYIELPGKYCSPGKARTRRRSARSVNRIIRTVKSGKNVCATPAWSVYKRLGIVRN